MWRAKCSLWMSTESQSGRTMALDLGPIPSHLRAAAIAKLEAGNVIGFLDAAGNQNNLELVYLTAVNCGRAASTNARCSRRSSPRAPTITSGRYRYFGRCSRRHLVGAPVRLTRFLTMGRSRSIVALAAVVPLGGYADCLGPGRLSAQWFAARAAQFGLVDPAVYCVTIEEGDVLAYINARQEQEFIVPLAGSVHSIRIAARMHSKAVGWLTSQERW